MNKIASPAAPSILGIWPSSNPGIPSVNLKTASSGSSAHSDLSSQQCSTFTLLTHADIDISGRIGKQRCLSCTGTPWTTKLAKSWDMVSESCVPITMHRGLMYVGIYTMWPGLCVCLRYCPTLLQMLMPQQIHQERFTTRCWATKNSAIQTSFAKTSGNSRYWPLLVADILRRSIFCSDECLNAPWDTYTWCTVIPDVCQACHEFQVEIQHEENLALSLHVDSLQTSAFTIKFCEAWVIFAKQHYNEKRQFSFTQLLRTVQWE